jgi:peptide deformylase
MRITRRELTLGAAAGLLTGCATRALRLPPAGGHPEEPWSLSQKERRLLEARRPDFALVVKGGPGAAVLRRRARPVPPGMDLERVAARMERTMRKAGGVGIAGPQVGLPLRVASLVLDYKTDHPRVVFVRNPLIVERSEENIEGYEGCLSVPGVGGLVRRSRWIRVRHTALDGEVRTTSADGANAVLWQHELDHLDGVLYVDRLLGQLLPMDEVRRRRRELEQKNKRDTTSDDARALRL